MTITARKTLGVAMAALLALSVTACASPATGTVNKAQEPAQSQEPTTEAPAPEPEETEDPQVALAETAASYAEHLTGFDAINYDMQSAIDDEDYDSASMACSDLSDWASEGLALDTLGLPKVDKHWDASMKWYVKAGNLCEQGFASLNVGQVKKAITYLGNGVDEMGLAADALGEVV